jgi:hypothetical protein
VPTFPAGQTAATGLLPDKRGWGETDPTMTAKAVLQVEMARPKLARNNNNNNNNDTPPVRMWSTENHLTKETTDWLG